MGLRVRVRVCPNPRPCPSPHPNQADLEAAHDDSAAQCRQGEGEDGCCVYSTRELEAVWARRESAPLLLLVVVGKVYNVSAGRAFYGSVGAGYEGFASGADHTRAFLTADFEHNATDDLGNLTHAQLLGVAHWAQFYEDHAVYKYAGVHVGRFYNAQGHATAARRVYEVSVAAAKVNPGA